MIYTTKCPDCDIEFQFDTDDVRRLSKLSEATGDAKKEPIEFYPRCPKCAKPLTVPNPEYRP